MADLTGRCKNVEYCANASSQRIITVPEGEAFVCPKCGEPLEESRLKRWSTKQQITLGVQVLVLVAGAGGVAYKLTGGFGGPAAPSQGVPAANAAPATTMPLVDATPPPDAQANTAPATAAQPPPAQAAAPAATPAASADAASTPSSMLVRMAGSDVIGTRLARRLASGYLALIGDSDIALVQGASADTVALTANQAGEHEAIGIVSTSSAAGFGALLRGTADIALSARPVNAAEIEKLASVGDLTDPASEHVIAVQGIAAIVSPANRVPSLSVAQLRGIVAGQITDWSRLGGKAGPIHVILQDSKAGARDTAADLVLAGAAPAAGLLLQDSEEAVATHVAADRNAIGLVALGNAGTARAVPVSAGDTAPVAPSELAVSTEDYPLTRRLFLYTAGTPTNVVRRFTDYVASPNGQAAVEAAGFVPLTVKAEPAAVPDAASSRFRNLVTGATRVSIDFRFQPGSTALDSRGARDVERLAAYMRAQHATADRLILAGFADSHGSPEANAQVSQRRTDAVVAALAKTGITPGHAVSFGAELPVADNATPEGRERNRRVEVYLSGS